MRAGLDDRAPDCFDLIGPPGDASADGRVVVATDGVGVLVFEVDH